METPMNWITAVVRPKVRTLLRKQTSENLWIKCPETGELVFQKDVEANLWVIPGSKHHLRITAAQRLSITLDLGSQEDVPLPDVPVDPLRFRDKKRYVDRLKEARAMTGLQDAVKVARGTLEGIPVTVAVQDFHFMTGSHGMAAGEAIITAAEAAISHRTPLILFACGGGMRMQEGVLSLMQMPRTTVAVRRLRAAKLPYLVVLTDPTTGGITASYAMLGDVHLAEPGALIGFAGQRVIEQTIREKLPEGFQRAEYLKEHGMVDMVVPRADMRATLARLCGLLTRRPAAKAASVVKKPILAAAAK
ncbi:acetyl-CoA carboxylase, carboxyltransferase subunit beta [Bosea sp. 2KB_26]|uniref:acetyl-CoA carboxylase, carboxyltransferase subunit beta n=1 Tax=Bosea sp. 2KB_26 TaxID=3237475 RepID=UPI003F9325E7